MWAGDRADHLWHCCAGLDYKAFSSGLPPRAIVGRNIGHVRYVCCVPEENPSTWSRKIMGSNQAQLSEKRLAISTPLLLIVGIRTVVFTVTELGAVLVLYAIFVGWLIHRELKWREISHMHVEGGFLTANVMLVVGVSSFIAYLIVVLGIPDTLQAVLQGANLSRIEFLLLDNLVFLVAGMFLDSTPATLILIPIFLPAAISYA